jgi:hypothetical protein
MKKIIALAGFFLFMVSCSNDDAQNTNAAEDTTLLKKMTSTNEEGITSTYDYTYNGNKIVSMISDDTTIIYTYTGNLITHITSTQSNGVVIDQTIEYNSSNQKTSQIILISAPDLGVEQGTKDLYTYNQNGTVTVVQYSGDLESQTTLEGTGTITINENSILHEGMSSQAYTHTFDSKNNPMKNILGYNEYTLPRLGSKHNLLLGATTSTRSGYIFTYTYNSNNYPISSVQKTYEVDKYVTTQNEYFYE